VPEQMMGSVVSIILGGNCAPDVGWNCAHDGRAAIGVAIIAIGGFAAVSGHLASTCEGRAGDLDPAKRFSFPPNTGAKDD
jgi:hypothetical protein